MGVRYIGAEVQRMEDPRLITGHGRYVDDITMQGMLHAAFLRASQAHAKIRSIDTSRAAEMPGVQRVFTLADFAPEYRKPMNQLYPAPVIEQNKTQYPLAKDEV
ncbi:MAG: xanthine dehydrogenase family protein molybdopterin-binding subunit, partial [Alphaproteobacteria bacterium]